MTIDVNKYLIHSDLTVVQVMKQIDDGTKGIVYVVDDNGRLIGSVTDGDIRRWLIKTVDLNATVKDFMSVSTKFIYPFEEDKAEKYLDKYSINSIPIVDKDKKVLDIVFRNFSEKINDSVKSEILIDVPVVIMAGGKGTRLYPYTMVFPKPLIPVAGTPIVERIIKDLCDKGVQTFYLSVNYKKSMVKSYFEDLNLPCTIKYIEEDKPLGTGGSLKLIKDKLKVPFIVTNCDTLIRTDISDAYEQHINSSNPMTIVSSLKNITVPYGVLQVDEDCTLRKLQEKPMHSYFINTGMYIVNPEVLDMIPDGEFFHMTHLAQSCMDNGMKVGIYPISEDSFLDMGEFEEMKRMEEKL